MFLTANDVVEGIGSLTTEQGAAIGATFVILILLCIIILQTIDFLLTMFVYNHVATKSNPIIRILITALIFTVVNVGLSFVFGQLNPEYAQPITMNSVMFALIDALVGVLIAKLCTDKLQGSLLAKSFKGTLLYIPISIGVLVIFALIFGGSMFGAVLPEIMKNIKVPTN